MPPTRVLIVDPVAPDGAAVAEAAAVLRAGGLVVFPTETVYGLGASALDAAAIAGIFRAKERPSTDPLIVHVASLAEVSDVAREIPAVAAVLAARFWPGPLTLILPKREEVPASVTAGLDSVGVRVPAHPVALALLRAAGVPVAAPSANRFSRPSPTRAAHVLEDLEGRVDLVLDAGATDIGVESTVLDLTVDPPLVRRPGGVSLEALREVLPEVAIVDRVADAAVAQEAPGQLLRHYAPRAPLTCYDGAPALVVTRLAAEARAQVGAGLRIGILASEEDLLALAPMVAALGARGRVETRAYGSRRDPARAARELFEALRGLDATGVDRMLAAMPATGGIGRAMRDRLMRAAEGRVVPVRGPAS
ncbi:MAG: L-threonylcarbamoyladenylate synthase [Vicinamibacterales bacterium]|nr:L-threonylcarbamoyladenylate synthase [Vicinamibacterales bacterium]